MPVYYEIEIVCTPKEMKKCLNCGNYFIPLHRSDTVYCDEISPGSKNKTCKEVGPNKTFEQRIKNDEAEYLRRKIYQALLMRTRRQPEVTEHKENLLNWKSNANQWKKDVKNGVKTYDMYLKWLKDNKQA